MSQRPFEQIVEAHGRTVLRVCRALLNDAEADDAWSETFLSALGAYPDLEPGANVEAWLVTIAKRKVIDLHRRRGRAPVPVEVLPEPSARTPPTIADRDDELWAALASLPPKQRAAVALHHISGFSYAEVGEMLGNSEQAARRAAADGVKRLRATYGVTRVVH